MKIKNIITVGVASLAMGTFFGVSLPVEAGEFGWKTAPQLDYFQMRGLVRPGSYAHHDTENPATIAVNKSGQGIGGQNSTASKAAKKGTQHRTSTTKDF